MWYTIYPSDPVLFNESFTKSLKKPSKLNLFGFEPKNLQEMATNSEFSCAEGKIINNTSNISKFSLLFVISSSQNIGNEALDDKRLPRVSKRTQ